MGYDISIPVLSATNTFVNALSDGLGSLTEKSLVKRKKRMAKFIDSSIELLLLSQGIPYRTPKKLIKGIVGKKTPRPSRAVRKKRPARKARPTRTRH